MKRIYYQTVLKWLIGLGGSLAVGIFAYLSMIGAIEITAHGGDMVCEGTIEDPCYAYINFTAKEDIFIYPIDYDPWGRDFIVNFEPAVKEWKLQRSWGTGWRNIPLDKSCTGTWCGLSNADDTRKFSVAFREGRDYQIRVVGYKNNPSDTIKWAVNYEDKEYLDPTWQGVTTTLLLDGLEEDRKYEYGTTVNISAFSDFDNPICIDLIAPDYGLNYTCGTLIECYQESANVSTSCGGLDTGNYEVSGAWSDGGAEVFDGNWTTSDYIQLPMGDWHPADIYVNYSKPTNAQSTSIWRVKDSNAEVNLTIDSSCWAQDILQFNITNRLGFPGYVVWSCRNETGWPILRYVEDYGLTNYEEAMIWDILIPNFIELHYIVGDISSDNWTIDVSDDITFGLSPQQVNMTAKGNVTVNRAEFNITGYDSSGYPTGLQCDAANDGSLDFSFPGNFTGNTIHQSYNSEGKQEDTITFSTEGASVLYFNISANPSLVGVDNSSINFTGGFANPEGYDYIEYYSNSSYIYAPLSSVNNQFVYEDFSIGDVSGRWGGTYDMSIGEKITTSCFVGCSPGGCSSPNTGSCSANMYSQELDLTTYGSLFFKTYIAASRGSSPSDCGGVENTNSESGSLHIRDKTTGSNVLSVIDLTTSADTSIWEFRKVGNIIKTYDDGVYNNEVAFDPAHQYEILVQVGGTCKSYDETINGAGQGYIQWINTTGITGQRIDNFTWGNGSIMSEELMNFSTGNISSAILTATESVPSDTETSYYLSANNGTDWEEVTNGVAHVFTTQGHTLRYMANATGTSIKDTSGDQSEQAIIYDIRVQVIATPPENISIDVGADGTIEWSMDTTLYSNESIIGNFSGDSITSYVSNYCQGDVDCLLPVSISTIQPGALQYNLVDINQTFATPISISPLTNLTVYLEESNTIPLTCSAEQGIVNFTDLDLRYRSEENITVFAYHHNNTLMNDTRQIQIRYSPFEVNYPTGVLGWELYPSNWTEFNVTPYGQEILWNDTNNHSVGGLSYNFSIGIFNISNNAAIDPIDIIVRLNESITSECINMSLGNSLHRGDSQIINTTDAVLISNFEPKYNTTKVFMWVDLFACDSAGIRYWNPQLIFNSHCKECVWPQDI